MLLKVVVVEEEIGQVFWGEELKTRMEQVLTMLRDEHTE